MDTTVTHQVIISFWNGRRDTRLESFLTLEAAVHFVETLIRADPGIVRQAVYTRVTTTREPTATTLYPKDFVLVPPKVWCVRRHEGEGFCALERNHNPGDPNLYNKIATKCGSWKRSPLHFEFRLPDCEECSK